jgi:hypothetical protein
MATKHGHESGNERNPSVGFDKSDLGARGILIFFLVLALSAVAVHLCVLGLYVGMTRAAEKHDPEVSPLASKTVTPRAEILQNTADINAEQFPQPRLLRHIRGPIGDQGEMTKLLLEEAAVLTARSWQDAQGNMHLPIEQAMKAVVTRLPVRAGAMAALPNYPGTGRQDANEALAADAAAPQSESVGGEAGNPAATK